MPPEEPQPPAHRKPLWALMGRAPQAPQPEAPKDETAQASSAGTDPKRIGPSPSEAPTMDEARASEPVGEAPASAPAAAAGRRGLWGLMKSTAPASPGVVFAEPSPETEAPIESEVPSTARQEPRPPREEVRPVVSDAGTPAADDAALATLIGIESDATVLPGARQSAGVDANLRIKARLALALGALSIPLAFLALIDTAWSRLPATVVGFASILLGMLALAQAERSAMREAVRKLAIAGMVAGVLGMFLGPLVLAGLGRRMLQSSSREFTQGHLRTIGAALDQYYEKNATFPPGGTFQKTKDGRQKGFHGWMTFLLPFLGEEKLYEQIRQDVPFDDAANRPAFEQDVFVFFAAGSDRARVRGRFGAAHFAGVGGDVTDEAGNESQAGIFGINSKVTRDAVTDGLSNTLAVGEIADDFPPWGDPENWRLIGPGLNRAVDGFGNHARSGASFLMADGSVRFFSNKTDPRVLQALSTRNGGEE